MIGPRPFTWVAAATFAILALAHIVRLLLRLPITIGTLPIPGWVSIVAILVTAFLSWMLCREARGTKGP